MLKGLISSNLKALHFIDDLKAINNPYSMVGYGAFSRALTYAKGEGQCSCFINACVFRRSCIISFVGYR